MLSNTVIQNIRYGLATNSSSSHSIIHNPTLIKLYPTEGNGGDLNYGWDFFTLDTKKAKKRYLLTQLAGNVSYSDQEIFKLILNSLGYNDAASEFKEMEVDHESVMSFPSNINGGVHIEFFSEYMNYIVDGDFVILGGNDNDDKPHELAGYDDGTETYFQAFDPSVTYKNGNYWVIQNTDKKLRVQFQGEEPLAIMPELVDIKITDRCSIGCDFCYQGSTPAADHAEYTTVKTMIDATSSWQTQTEYAIGGGEPTEHPEFTRILRFIKETHNIANFTTRSSEWFLEPDIVKTVRECVSGIAYSVGTIDEFKQFHKYHQEAFPRERQNNGPEFYLHLIPELMGQDAFREIIAAVDDTNRDLYNLGLDYTVHVTLLGFKSLGRAKDMQRELIPEIVDIIKLTKHIPIGIDTKFAHDYKEFLEAHDVDPKLYRTEEGEYSMYVDCMNKKAYKSSWHLDNPVDVMKTPRPGSTYTTARSIKEIFAEIQN